MINKGQYAEGTYVKHTDFNRAVLWKTRELSIPVDLWDTLTANRIHTLIFIDKHRRESWVFKMRDIDESKQWRKVGQEPQYYFPINLRA